MNMLGVPKYTVKSGRDQFDNTNHEPRTNHHGPYYHRVLVEFALNDATIKTDVK
jgi:hypothetical protein